MKRSPIRLIVVFLVVLATTSFFALQCGSASATPLAAGSSSDMDSQEESQGMSASNPEILASSCFRFPWCENTYPNR